MTLLLLPLPTLQVLAGLALGVTLADLLTLTIGASA